MFVLVVARTLHEQNYDNKPDEVQLRVDVEFRLHMSQLSNKP